MTIDQPSTQAGRELAKKLGCTVGDAYLTIGHTTW